MKWVNLIRTLLWKGTHVLHTHNVFPIRKLYIEKPEVTSETIVSTNFIVRKIFLYMKNTVGNESFPLK